MTKRGWTTAALAFLIGLAVGAGGVQSCQRFHEKATAGVFSRRLHCKELANQYARKESNDKQSVSVETVGYAAAPNSCVAYFQIWEWISPQYTVQKWLVMDVFSGEQLYTDQCREERDCGGGKDLTLDRRGEAAFRQAVNGQVVAVEKVK
jgi:hypothetical protein